MANNPCQCALTASSLFGVLHDLLDIYNEHAKTGKLPVTAREIREEVESALNQLEKVGGSCRIDIEPSKYFLKQAIEHYESGLRRGDIHSLAEAAEIAAETELPLLRELIACAEKEE